MISGLSDKIFGAATRISIKQYLRRYFYRTQVSLGSGLWVLVSLSMSLPPGLCETLLMWLWLMMIPTQYDWWCQFKAIPCNSWSMSYMQVALADGQSKIVGILGVKWNNIARGTTDPGYWVHNSNHPNSRCMLIVESTLSTWSALFDLLFAFGYFYKTQEVVFLVFVSPYFS